LPFGLLVKPDGKLSLFVDGKEVTISEFSEVEWGGGTLNKPYVKLAISDYDGVMHLIKIAYDGDSNPFVSIDLAGRAREIYSVRYLDEVKVLEIVYMLKYEGGIKKHTHTIVLKRIPVTIILEGEVYDFEKEGEGWLGTLRLKDTDWEIESEKGYLGCLIALDVLSYCGFTNLHIDESKTNKPGEGEKRFYIFDVCGTDKEERFVAFEVKLSTVTKEKMLENLQDESEAKKLQQRIGDWNNKCSAIHDPHVEIGIMFSIYIDKRTGHFWFRTKKVYP